MGNTLNLPQSTGDRDLDKALAVAGYAYDPSQDIFISTMDPWQRNVGYCRLYDEAAAPLGMIIDSEPVYFEYNQKKWMIGIWKGQYDMVVGGEVGVYTNGIPVNLPGIFQGTFYQTASNEDCLHMAFTLKKNGKVVFSRKERHWWLTGFVLGEFAEPSELTMEIQITFKDEEMRKAFVEAIRKVGYSSKELQIIGNKVSFIFEKPRSPQPFTRTPKTDQIIQRKNKYLCDKFQEITGPYNTFPEKLAAVQEQLPDMYRLIMNMGKSKQVFEIVILLTLAGVVAISLYTSRRD